MHRAAAAIACLCACAGPVEPLNRALSEGDVAVVVVGVEDLATAQVALAFADASGVAELSRPSDRGVAVAIVERARVLDHLGAGLDPRALGADLEGDLEGACGCSVPSIDGSYRLAPGDRCAIAPSTPLDLSGLPADAELEARVRERLRLVVPGACACPSAPPVARADLEVCPIGEGLERLAPERLALADDGTLVLASRGLVAQLRPNGEWVESALSPALGALEGVAALPRGGAILIGERKGTTYAQDSTDVVYVPPQGGPARALEDVVQYRNYGLVRSRTPGTYYLGGDRRSVKNFPAVARCSFGDDPDAVRCEDLVLEQDSCDAYRNQTEAIKGVTELEGGDLLAVDAHGLPYFFRGDEAYCVRGAGPLQATDARGRPFDAPRIEGLTSVGRRAIACIAGLVGGQLDHALLAAEIAPPDAPSAPRWTRLELPVERYRCGRFDLHDPHDPAHALFQLHDGDAPILLRVSETSSTAERVPLSSFAPGVDAPLVDVASSTSALVVGGPSGEVWARKRPGGAMEPLLTPFTRPRPTARAILAIDGGYEIYAGGRAPLELREGASCAAHRLSVPPDALPSSPDDGDDAVTRLGDRTLVFGHRGAAVRMAVRAASGASGEEHALPGRAWVIAAVEVAGGVVLLRADGSVWQSDGAAPTLLDRGPWRSLSASPGVAWLAGGKSLARVVAAPGGGRAFEPLDAHVDARALEALGVRAEPYAATSIQARCDGSAIVAYDDALPVVEGLRTFTQTTICALAPSAGALALIPLDALATTFAANGRSYPGSIPVDSQQVMAGNADPSAPLFLFSADHDARVLELPPKLWSTYAERSPSDGVYAPAAPMTALPFAGFTGFARDGRRALVGADFLRLATVRVRPHGE